MNLVYTCTYNYRFDVRKNSDFTQYYQNESYAKVRNMYKV